MTVVSGGIKVDNEAEPPDWRRGFGQVALGKCARRNPVLPIQDPSLEYRKRLSAYEQKVKQLQSLDLAIGITKLFVVAALIVFAWRIANGGPFFLFLCAGITIIAFAALLVFHQRVIDKRDASVRRSDLYRRGLARIEDRWAGSGENGNQFRDPDHPYADDLDLLGERSMYQLLCTCRTRMGKKCLAKWLLAPATSDVILQRQSSVRELRDRLDFKEELSTIGDSEHIESNPERLDSWAGERSKLNYQRWWPVALILALGSINTISFGIAVNWLPFVLVMSTCQVVFMVLRRQVDAVLGPLNAASKHLSLLARFLERIEQEQFETPLLLALQRQLVTNGLSASECIAKLSTIADFESSRRSLLGRAIDRPLMYSVQVACALERWRTHYGHHVRLWLDTIGELETLIALSCYCFEHPQDPFPEFLPHSGSPAFCGRSLGHPLMPNSTFVRNDVALDRQTQILLISGSNMSGKSTLLRVVGMNAVLAMMGAAVRAEVLQLSAISIGATIRVSDSLQNGESRFYAEIKRIRAIVDLASRGPTLFLFDEILQGTNSSDRRAGAEGVIKALLDCNSIGLATTHDLALTAIANLFPGKVRNVHFQERFLESHLTFDYRMRDGVATTSNGIELMRLVGLKV